MLSNYFTLAALAREWDDVLRGSIIRDVYSPHRDELSIDLTTGGETQSIRISVRAGFHFIYRALRAGRPRSNVATLFEEAIGGCLASVEMSPTDRILSFNLEQSRRLDVHLYGSQANVFLVVEKGGDHSIHSAFKKSDRYEGTLPPLPKALPDFGPEALVGVDEAGTLERRLSRLRPRLAKPLIHEVFFRTGIDRERTGPLNEAEAKNLAKAVDSVTSEMEAPDPVRYASADGGLFSLTPLRHLGIPPDRTFASVDEGVRATVLNRIRLARFEDTRRPLLRTLDRATEKAEKKAAELEKAASSKSRADEYERRGHLLMANPAATIHGDTLMVSDVLSDGRMVGIPVKTELSVVENAQRYYRKAKDLRTERATLDGRLREARTELATLERLQAEAAAASDVHEIERFVKTHAPLLQRFGGWQSKGSPEPVPFRRLRIAGFEVWVGRNARENDRLTFDHASPRDLWFHARGVPGSHVVLRVPGRKTVVGKPVLEATAAVAAWYSSSRGSHLVPVIMTERKYVSKPRGSDPGVVRVHREDVLMVEPGLP